MKYRDHVALGGTIFGGLFYLYLIHGVRIVALFFPLVYVLDYHGRFSLIMTAVVSLAFFTGCALPDFDANAYPCGGHRTQSPWHNLLLQLIVYAAVCSSVPAVQDRLHGLIQREPILLAIIYILPAISAGCLAHLLGDFIQGGIGFGLPGLRRGRRKKSKLRSLLMVHRIGFSRFNWTLYTESVAGKAVTFLNIGACFAMWAWLCVMAMVRDVHALYSLAACFLTWLYSFVFYRSCARCLTTSLAFLIAACALYVWYITH